MGHNTKLLDDSTDGTRNATVGDRLFWLRMATGLGKVGKDGGHKSW